MDQKRDEQRLIDEVAPLAEAILATPASKLTIQVIETKFRWVREGRVVWARTRDMRSAMFHVVLGRPPVYLGGPDALARLSELLVTSTGPLPHGLSPVLYAEAIRQLTFEPRGQIASLAFLAGVTPYLADWLHEDDAPSRARFAAACVDPTLEDRGGGQFALTFHAFDVEGGVERWVVTGDATRFLAVTRAMLLPQGTFRWPAA